jgi:hypothetical protein
MEPYDQDRAVLAINMIRNHLSGERGSVKAGLLLGEPLEKVAGLMAITVLLGRHALGGEDQLDAHLRDSIATWEVQATGPERPVLAARTLRALLAGDRAGVAAYLGSTSTRLELQAGMLVLAVGAGRHAFGSDMDAFSDWLDAQADAWRHRD